jgi:hypothetical protein
MRALQDGLARVLILSLWLGCQPDPPAVPLVPEAADPADFEARRRAIVGDLKALTSDLEAAGRYDCCIDKPCLHCARMAGGCRCGEGLRKGEPVCEECALMWRKGRGAEPGVDPASVRSFLEASDRGEGHPACGCGEAAAQGTKN